MLKKIKFIILPVIMGMSLVGCTSIEKEFKTFKSGTTGLHRIAKVIAMDGTLVAEYESKSMLVSDGDGGTIVLDFDGKRVVLCNSQVIIEEVK